MANELELKLNLGKQCAPEEVRICLRDALWAADLGIELSELRALQASGAPLELPGFIAKHLRNIYFDDEQLSLNTERVALRIRHVREIRAGVERERWLQTLKTKGRVVDGVHQRGEWEQDLNVEVALNGLPSLELSLLDSAGSSWPAHVGKASLRPVFETNFTRHQLGFEYKGFEFEFAYDVGSVIAAPFSDVICECEIELLAPNVSSPAAAESDRVFELGQAAAVMRELGDALAKALPFVPSNLSKAERGYTLYGKRLISESDD